MRSRSIALAVGAAAAACAVLPSPAQSATICVRVAGECPAGGTTVATLAAAARQAADNADADTIRLGPGSFAPSGTVELQGADELLGAGTGDTVLEGAVSTDGAVAVRDLTVRMVSGQTTGVQAVGGSLSGVDVDGAAATSDAAVGVGGQRGTTIKGARITMAAGAAVAGTGIGRPTVEDAVLDAPTGTAFRYYGMTLRRVRITATVGVDAPDGAATLDTVAIRLRDMNGTGVRIGPTTSTAYDSTATHVTIDGDDSTGSTGIDIRGACGTQGAEAEVDQTAIGGVEVALRRGASCPSTPQDAAQTGLTVTRSAFDPARVVSEGPGGAQIEPPVATELGIGEDLVPKAGSGLIDAGDPAEAKGVDVLGRPRPVDGDASGTAVVDVGAFERQEVGPAPTPDGGEDVPVDPTTDLPYTDYGSGYGVGDSGSLPDLGGVLGEVSGKRRPGRPRTLVSYGPRHPRRFAIAVRVPFPKGTSARRGTVTLELAVRKKRLLKTHKRLDAKGRARFVVRLPKSVKRRQVGLRVTFAGTRTLTRRAGRWTGLY